MKKIALAGLGLAALAAAAAPARAQAPTPINISYQPSTYWGLTFYIATEKGWWKDAGLEPTFSTFPTGAPQVAAAASKAWDVGGTGAPAVLGAQRIGLETIGIMNNSSAVNALIARDKDAEAIKKDPTSLKGKQLLLTTNSTGEYAARICLQKWGLDLKDLQVVNLNPSEIISAFATGTGTIAATWAPNTYRLEDKAGGQVLCNGKDAGVVIPGLLVTRGDYGKEHPDKVAAFLAVYLHTLAWQKTHRAETIALMKTFYERSGLTLADQFLGMEIDTQPTLSLDEQLAAFDRSKGAAKMDEWIGQFANYLKSTGSLQTVPEPTSYITDAYLKRVAADPKLKSFAEDK
jgi:ABC-type nitrate/sulfonate/bicarbonate transport system substrate-binding protein